MTQAHIQPQPPTSVKKSHKTPRSRKPLTTRILYGICASLWVVAMFFAAQYLIVFAIQLLDAAGASLPVAISDTVLQTGLSVLVYILAITIVIAVPWKLLKQRLTWADVGFAQPLPEWRDIGLAPVVFILSLIGSVVAMYIVSLVLPSVDLETQQQIGFDNISQRYELLLAFFTLVVLAPICEEMLFRGYLYGRVRRYYSAFWTILLTSVVFGLMHLYAGEGNPLQWNAMIGTAVLALFIGALREYTGNIWAGILVHMLKNAVAFFALFIAPLLGMTLVQ